MVFRKFQCVELGEFEESGWDNSDVQRGLNAFLAAESYAQVDMSMSDGEEADILVRDVESGGITFFTVKATLTFETRKLPVPPQVIVNPAPVNE